MTLLGIGTRVTSWQSSSAARQHTTATTTTLVRGERGQWRRVCWRPSWCVRRVLSGGEEGRREKGGDQRSGRGLTRKEETWCSTAGGRRHQTWAQTREKRTAAAGIWQLAALAAGREETPLPVSLGRWRLMHTHTFTNLAALFPVFPAARDSRSRRLARIIIIIDIGGWHIAIYLFKISEMHAEMAM